MAICKLLIGKTKEAIEFMEKTAEFIENDKVNKNEIFI